VRVDQGTIAKGRDMEKRGGASHLAALEVPAGIRVDLRREVTENGNVKGTVRTAATAIAKGA
jgi:hypothetical protein